jgi:hypothetical protein
VEEWRWRPLDSGGEVAAVEDEVHEEEERHSTIFIRILLYYRDF